MSQKRVIIVEVEIPNGDADYAHFVQSAPAWDVLQHGNVVADYSEHDDGEFAELAEEFADE